MNKYVSDPRRGGRHTRGTAVDLTLITKEGQELVMPSKFDDFSEKAHQDYMGASDEAIKNLKNPCLLPCFKSFLE